MLRKDQPPDRGLEVLATQEDVAIMQSYVAVLSSLLLWRNRLNTSKSAKHNGLNP